MVKTWLRGRGVGRIMTEPCITYVGSSPSSRFRLGMSHPCCYIGKHSLSTDCLDPHGSSLLLPETLPPGSHYLSQHLGGHGTQICMYEPKQSSECKNLTFYKEPTVSTITNTEKLKVGRIRSKPH